MSLVCLDMTKAQHSNLTLSTISNLNRTKIVKKRIAIINFIAIITALYLYDRHNRYCEPGVYSMFSLLEYVVIVANVVYHLQAFYDLDEHSIIVARSNVTKSSSRIPDKKRE